MSVSDRTTEVMDAALQVFAEYGYKKATLEDIANRLRLTKGALYVYADGKRDLYEKCVGKMLIAWQSCVAEAVSREEDVRNQFTALCRSSFNYLLDHPEVQMILRRDPDVFPLFGEDDPYRNTNLVSIGMLDDILARGVGEGQFRPIDRGVVTDFLFWVYKMVIIGSCVTGGDFDVRRTVEGGLDLVLHGLFIS